jgi:hypothetical protein
MKYLILASLLFAPLAFAEEPTWKIDCGWFSGYIGGLAALRDEGKTEEEIVQKTQQEMVNDEPFPPRIQRHLKRIVHDFIFWKPHHSPSELANGYFEACVKAGGNIKENEDAES